MENETADSARISWYINKDSIHQTAFSLENDDRAEFLLAPSVPGNRVRLNLPPGHWNEDELKKLVKDMDSVELKWKGGKTVMRKQDEMLAFLKARRKGITKQTLFIRVGNN